MISPDFLMSYAISKGVVYLYDANLDGIINMRDIDLIAQTQHCLSVERFDFNSPGEFK